MRAVVMLWCLSALGCGHEGDTPAPSRTPETPASLTELPPSTTASNAEVVTPGDDGSGAGGSPGGDVEPTRPFTPAPCEVGPDVEVGSSQARRAGVAVALDGRGGLLAFSADDAHVTLRPLDASAQPSGEPVTVEMPGAMDLSQLRRVGGRFVLVTHTLCPDTPPSHALKCLFFQPFDATGSPAGARFQHQTGEWSAGPSEVEGDALVMLRSHTYMAPVLERYRLAADGTITREQLGDLGHGIARGESEPAQGVALAVDGERVAALVRLEGDAAPAFFLHFADGHTARVGGRLPGDATVRSLAFVADDRLELVFARGERIFRAELSVDGRIVTPPTDLAQDVPGPGPARLLLRSTEEGPRNELGLVRGDGRWIDPPVALPAARVLRAGGENGLYAVASVATGRRPRSVSVRAARCAAPTAPP